MKKKVCYILPQYNPQTDTHFAYLYDFLKVASQKLDIFLIIEKYTAKDIEGNFKRVYWQKFKWGPLRMAELSIVLRWARFSGYNNFYTHYSYIGAFLTGILSRFTFARSFYWNCASAWNLKQKLRSRFGLKLALRTTQFLVTGTDGLRKEYAKHYRLSENKIKVMPNWIDIQKFNNVRIDKDGLRKKYKITEGKKVLLFVHHISGRKGSRFLVPIFKNLGSEYVLLIIGQGPREAELAAEIKASGLDTKIKMLGFVPNKEIAELYQLADLFLMPSKEEGFPRVLLEAMASSLPYVAFDTGGVREISPPIAQNFILPVGEVKNFTQKIESLLSNQKIYNKFISQEEEKVKEFSQEKALDIFINLFK